MPEVGDPLDPCPQCLRERGLCAKHYAGILPLLSRNIGWLRLIGDALVEQKLRQMAKDAAIEKAHRRTARRRTRAGYAGLVMHVRTAA